jgi:two-component system response regulator FlrC
VERETILLALAAHQGNRRKAAEQLGIGLRTLYTRLREYGISVDQHEDE